MQRRFSRPSCPRAPRSTCPTRRRRSARWRSASSASSAAGAIARSSRPPTSTSTCSRRERTTSCRSGCSRWWTARAGACSPCARTSRRRSRASWPRGCATSPSRCASAYVTNVFRYDEPHVGRYREFYQAGVELVGLPNPEGDAEMIAMTVEGLRALGLEHFQIDVGQADFFRGILEDSAPTRPPRASCARRWAARTSLGARAPRGRARRARRGDASCSWPCPRSTAAATCSSARSALVKNARSEAALVNLAEVYRLLRAYGLADSVLLDLGEVRGFDYYSGVHFEAYVSGLGAPLVGGGRYDQMLGPLRLRLPGHRLRLRGRAGAPGHGVAGHGGRAARARTSSSSTSRPTRPAPSRSPGASATSARRWRATSSAGRSRSRWPTRASSARAGPSSSASRGRDAGDGARAGSAGRRASACVARGGAPRPIPARHLSGARRRVGHA